MENYRIEQILQLIKRKQVMIQQNFLLTMLQGN